MAWGVDRYGYVLRAHVPRADVLSATCRSATCLVLRARAGRLAPCPRAGRASTLRRVLKSEVWGSHSTGRTSWVLFKRHDEEGHADQGRRGPVPRPRAAACHPGNLRGFVRVKFRNIRNGSLSDQKLRSEDTVERATLDEREMQYLYRDGDSFHFMDTDILRAAAHLRARRWRHRQLPDSRLADQGRVLRRRAGRHRAAADRRPEGRGHRARHQGRDRQRPGQAGAARDRPGRPGAAVRQHRRQGPGQHRNRRISLASLIRVGHHSHTPRAGWIEVITGSMFSGKSEELIRRLRRAQIAKRKVQIFKPKIDNRYGDDHIISHSEMRIAVREILSSSRELLDRVPRGHRGRRHRRGAVLRRRAAGGLQHAGRPGASA